MNNLNQFSPFQSNFLDRMKILFLRVFFWKSLVLGGWHLKSSLSCQWESQFCHLKRSCLLLIFGISWKTLCESFTHFWKKNEILRHLGSQEMSAWWQFAWFCSFYFQESQQQNFRFYFSIAVKLFPSDHSDRIDLLVQIIRVCRQG